MENKRISFVSLNIEGSMHLERVRNFLNEIKPDVICLQELPEDFFGLFKNEFKMDGVYAPVVRLPKDYKRDQGKVTGTAILSRLPIEYSSTDYYYGNKGELMFLDFANMALTEKYFLIKVKISYKKQEYVIATTHFVWTPDGQADEHQRKAIVSLLNLTKNEKSLVLCGDFNAPREREIFSILAEKYKDNIPSEYDSSLDPTLHRAKGLKLMVDGLFSTSDYRVEDVKLICGISDHCAVTAKISKN